MGWNLTFMQYLLKKIDDVEDVFVHTFMPVNILVDNGYYRDICRSRKFSSRKILMMLDSSGWKGGKGRGKGDFFGFLTKNPSNLNKILTSEGNLYPKSPLSQTTRLLMPVDT